MRTCACGNNIQLWIRIDGKRRNLKNRTKCLTCLPFGQSIHRPKSENDKRAGRAAKAMRYVAKFKEAHGIDPVGLLREARRAYILGLFDGRCPFCGYNRCARNITFHHILSKKHGLSSREFQFALSRIIRELKKCVPACHNCHGEIHDGVIPQEVVNRYHSEFIAKLLWLEKKEWIDVLGSILDLAIRQVGFEPTTSRLMRPVLNH